MAIETFASLPLQTVRSHVSVVIGSVSYGAFLVSTYTHAEDDSVDIKVAESLEVWMNSQWSYFYLNLESQQWSAVDNSVVNLSISLSLTSTSSAESIVNEGDVIVNEGDVIVHDSRQLRIAVDSVGDTVYGVWELDGEVYQVVWYNMDNSLYTGDVSTLEISNSDQSINNTVTLWYADLRTEDNQWLLLYQVISTDASGNILQVVYMQENGQVFNAYDYSLSQTYMSHQVTEVYQAFTAIDESVEVNIEQWVQQRELLELTINIVTPWTRRGKGSSSLILGNTVQVLPLGRKGYFDRVLPGHRIRTIPKVRLSNGSRLDCDLRFTQAATIVKSL